MKKALNLIGIAQKAGRVQAGEYLTMKAVKDGTAQLAVIAQDTSAKAKERIISSCGAHHCRTAVMGSKSELGRCIGAQSKSVVCLTDKGFAEALLKLLT